MPRKPKLPIKEKEKQNKKIFSKEREQQQEDEGQNQDNYPTPLLNDFLLQSQDEPYQSFSPLPITQTDQENTTLFYSDLLTGSEEPQENSTLQCTFEYNISPQAQSLETQTNSNTPAKSSQIRGKRLIYKKELAEGRLLANVKCDGNIVTLILNGYSINSYLSINKMLANLYNKNLDFQAKFLKPKMQLENVTLILKQEHGYQHEQEIITDLIRFAATSSNQNIRKALASGNLIDSLTWEENQVEVKLNLNEKYNKKELFGTINLAFSDLHKASKEFQTKFNNPSVKKKKHPQLILKSNHGYQNAQQILTDLIRIAHPKQRSSKIEDTYQELDVDPLAKMPLQQQSQSCKKILFKKELYEGKLLKDVEQNGIIVSLILKDEYNDDNFKKPICKMLYQAYQLSHSFKEKFERPRITCSNFALTLKPNHGYQNKQEILDDLINFAAPIPQQKIYQALIAKELFSSVTKNENLVIINLNEKYRSGNFKAINRAFYCTYRFSEEFGTKFYLPSLSFNEPVFILKPNHGYKSEEQIFDDLINFAKHKREVAKQTISSSVNESEQEQLLELWASEQEQNHLYQQEIASAFGKDEFENDLPDDFYYYVLPSSTGDYNRSITPLFDANKASNDASNIPQTANDKQEISHYEENQHQRWSC